MLDCIGFFFFKQKTAYDLRIIDRSSDVCSSDFYWFGNPSINPKLAMTIGGFASIAILGIARLTRCTYGALQEMARIRTQAESVRLLLREYEHRGVGWL